MSAADDAAGARIVDAPSLPVYDLGEHHPFARDRQLALFDLLRSSGLLHDGDLLPVRPATDAELHTIHDPDYVAMLQAVSAGRPDALTLRRAMGFGLGIPDNPIAPGQHRAAAATAGATRSCVEAVLDGVCRAACNPAGGLHHAMPHGAAGFCLYNDLALGIRTARARGVERVLYVDFDVHHGDGVERAFAADPSVLTISFHETPEVLYPGTGYVTDLGTGDGRGFALNVPLQPGTGDESFVACVEAVLVAAARAFRPGLIVSQHGCDTHRLDPLATLDCTTWSMHRAARITRQLADELCRGRWVATGGGGYQPVRVIPRAWSLLWATVAGRPLPAQVDAGWRARWAGKAAGQLPPTWYDDDGPGHGSARAAAANRATVEQLLDLVDWL